MTDTFSRVKNNLIELLNDPDQKVIALKGKWGTGKTYLWRVVEKELFKGKKVVKPPIYVSLFGAKTIDDLRIRILQNTYLRDESTIQKVLRAGGSFAKDLLQRVTGHSAVNTVLLFLPKIIEGRLIVIDDIERKHKALDIDEFLGLLDEYSETHNTRFLILLNTDKLNDPQMWAALHEKVVDVELTLEPSATEALDVAAQGMAFPYPPDIRAAVTALNLNNIRVIKRVVRTIERIEKASGVSDAPMSHLVPSTVLLTACHFRAIENAPSFEYVKNFNSFTHAFSKKRDKPNPQEFEWEQLLDRLGIKAADEYVTILQEYLQSGLLDVDRLKALFLKYKKEAIDADVTGWYRDFKSAVYWDPRQSESDLLAMARNLLPRVSAFDPEAVSEIIRLVEELGDAALAKQLLDDWLQAVESRPEYKQLDNSIFETQDRELHPAIVSKLNNVIDKQHQSLSVVEVGEYLFMNSGLGEREKSALRNSTIQKYEEALRNIHNEKLRHFLVAHLRWIRTRPFEPNFQCGADNFVAACTKIYSAEPEGRLSKIIFRTFHENGLADKLSPPTGNEFNNTHDQLASRGGSEPQLQPVPRRQPDSA